MGIEKMGSTLEGRARRNGEAIEVLKKLENIEGLDDLDYKQELMELREALKNIDLEEEHKTTDMFESSSEKQRTSGNVKDIDMKWVRKNEANEMYRSSNGSNGYDTSYSQRDPEADRRDAKEILEILGKMGKEDEKEDIDVLNSSSNLDESNERKKLEIYTEQDAEAERQKGFAIPRQYVILNGDKYYFSQEYIATPKDEHELNVDRIVQELGSSAGIEVSEKSFYKNQYYANTGLLPNGNMILKDPVGMMGIVNPYGDIIVDFKYHSIKPITNRYMETVHEDFFIAESNNSSYSNHMNRIIYPTGIIDEKGTELYPIDESDIEAIVYDDKNDIFHCCNYSDFVGLAYSETGFEKDRRTIYGNELSEDKYYDLEDKIFG